VKVIDRQLQPAVWLRGGTGAIYIKSSEGESARLDPSEFTTFDREFTSFTISDLSGNQNDLTLVIAASPIAAGKYGAVSVERPGAVSSPAQVTFGAAAGRSRILDANSDRFRAVIRSDAANTATVWIGTSTVNAGAGVPLLPGESMEISATGEVWGYCADASAPVFYRFEEIK